MSRRHRILAACIWACSSAFARQDPTPIFGTTVVVPGGLRGDVFHISRFSRRLPDLHRKKPVGRIYTSELNVPPRDFEDGFPGLTKRFEWFAIDYTGAFWIEKPGPYRFELTSDDGSQLWIDDRLAIDNDGLHPPQSETAALTLEGGIHRIRVLYFQGPRFQVALVLRVAAAGEDLRVFSTDEFKPPSDPATWTFPGSVPVPPSPIRRRKR